MKKVLSVFIIALLFVFSQASMVRAAGEIELYPYDKIECLESLDTCTNYKVGDANWDVVYNGYRYNVVSNNVRFASDFSDDNLNGFIDAFEMPAIGWNAFANVFINNTLESFELETANARTDLTTVVQRIYVYFDENGDLAMFEDHYVTKNYIQNDGTVADPDWRLATQAETDAYDAEVAAATIASGDTSASGTKLASIRIKLDATDADGYVAEPLGFLKWSAEGVDESVDPVADWSTVLDYNPNHVVIPAGWTVFSVGTLDRSGVNAKTVDWIKTLVGAMTDTATLPMSLEYTSQPGYFTGLVAEDDDAGTPGVNIVVDYMDSFDLPSTIEAEWLDMYNDTGDIINTFEKLDFSVDIAQDGVVLETIDYTWNSGTLMFDASAPVTVVDSSVFGSGYVATYSVTTPEGVVTDVDVDIVVGVMPPKFMGVKDVFADEDLFIDVLEGITADDGYGNDLTDDIVVNLPAGFNPYNPNPGSYDVDIEFNHHVFIPGIASTIDMNGTVAPWDAVLNPSGPINGYGDYMIFTDASVFAAAGSGWGSVMIYVAPDGTMAERYDRYNWEHTTSTGTVVGDSVLFAAWQANLVIEDGGFVLAAHGSILAPAIRSGNLAFGDPVSYVLGVEDFHYDILTQETFTITIDDTTAPQILAVNEEYTIIAGEFDNVNDAILSNVAAFDFTDAIEDLAVYVSDNGGLVLTTPGTYTVQVSVEDLAGNSAMVEFDVIVKAAPVIITQDEVETLITDAVDPVATIALTEAQIQALIDTLGDELDADLADAVAAIAALDTASLTQAEIQAIVDAAIADLPEDKVGTSTGTAVTAAVVAGVVALGGSIGFSFLKKF